MRRFRDRSSPPASVGVPWMLTYSDLVTQLLAIFVLLFAFSNVDAVKFRQLRDSLQFALGSVGPAGSGQGSGNARSTGGGAAGALAPLQAELEQVLSREGLLSDVQVVPAVNRLVVRLPAGVLFDSGWADLRPEAVVHLDSLAAVLKGLPNQIRVEGHTDDIPISTAQFPSNWELSAARAASVVRYLKDFHGLDPRRLEVAGIGPYAPVATNDTPEGRGRNRRVEVQILAPAAARPDRAAPSL